MTTTWYIHEIKTNVTWTQHTIEVESFSTGKIECFSIEDFLAAYKADSLFKKIVSDVMNSDFKLNKVLRKWEVHHMGWDIPTRVYLVEGDMVWWDDAHGHTPTHRCTVTEFLRKLGPDVEYSDVCKSLRTLYELKPKVPDWIVAALHAGWTPPENFDRSIYEW